MKNTLISFTIVASAALSGTAQANDIYDDFSPAVQAEADILVRGVPALPSAPNNALNKFWVEYYTDISEAKRELASDLKRATDAEDRREAYEEYEHEVRDARKDYAKAMSKRGYRVTSFRADAEIYTQTSMTNR